MPETFWIVRWPDGTEEQLYSPSSVVTEFFEPGTRYPVPDFLHRSRMAMQRASNRVKARYGYPCSLAMGQLDRIEQRTTGFDPEGDPVICLKITQ